MSLLMRRFVALLALMALDPAAIAAVLAASKDPMKRKGGKAFKPSPRQIWALMKNGATRRQCLDAVSSSECRRTHTMLPQPMPIDVF